jgi:hypothetical protein
MLYAIPFVGGIYTGGAFGGVAGLILRGVIATLCLAAPASPPRLPPIPEPVLLTKKVMA